MKIIWIEPRYDLTHIRIFCVSSCLLACSAFRCLNHPAAYLGVQAYRLVYFPLYMLQSSHQRSWLSLYQKLSQVLLGSGVKIPTFVYFSTYLSDPFSCFSVFLHIKWGTGAALHCMEIRIYGLIVYIVERRGDAGDCSIDFFSLV